MPKSKQPEDTTNVIYQLRPAAAGIANLIKEDNNPDAFWYAQCVDTRTDPYAWTLLPATQKESGSVVTDLLKFADMTPFELDTYAIGDGGNLYKRSSAGSWSLLGTAANSHGNGLQYFYGDDYMYYAQDSTFGRYGPTQGTPTQNDDFLTTLGSTPTNTNSLELVAASSQYAQASDSASLEITSDLTLEAYVNFNSLPSAGDSMSLVGKWDESGTTRAYLMDIYGISGFFGNGQDGSLTISSNTTQAPIDSACTGTSGSYSLSATNSSFAAGQIVVIWQTQGTNAGQEERNVIVGYTSGTISLQTPLQGSYTTGAQVIVIPQYTTGMIDSGYTWTAKAWNGTTGGRLVGLFTGTFTNDGTVLADGQGFRGGATAGFYQGSSGEGTAGASIQPPANQSYSAYTNNAANGSGGGGGSTDANTLASGAGGGSNGAAGTNGSSVGNGANKTGMGGNITGTTDLTTMLLGGGGGGGSLVSHAGTNTGGTGGGCIDIAATTITGSGTFTSNGTNGSISVAGAESGPGGGAGGSIRLKAQTATMSSLTCSAQGGSGANGYGAGSGAAGGAGSSGIIAIYYLNSYTDGTETPTPTYIQDNTLVTTTTYQLRMHISSNGTLNEIQGVNLSSLSTGQWNRFSIAWTAASSEYDFYQNGNLLATLIGTATAINSNAGKLYVGANKGSSSVGNFLDGYIDDVRVWSQALDQPTIQTYLNQELTGNEGNLQAYYKLDGAATDSTTNSNNLTLENTPSYSTNVPFSGATPINIDQQYTTTGSTYAVPTAISETLANQLPFTPQYDPQSAMDLDISGKGTGDWTVTIHDKLNNVIATSTIANASMASSGTQKFIFSPAWRINIGHSYHAHITSTVNDGTIVTSSSNKLQNNGSVVAVFTTYYQILVTDTFSHPMMRWLNYLVIGNERYLATWDGAFYQPNLIAFPPGIHIRCLGVWGAYLVAGGWQEPISGTPNVYDFPKGVLYFWDGISLTFNFSIDIPEGQVNAIYGMDADLYYIAGWKADLMYYHGTFANQSGAFNGTKVKRIPYLERGSYIETYPQAMCMWQGLLYFGMGGNSDSTAFPRNIYSWGTLYPAYPQILTSDYVISTGNNGSTVNIGLVFPVGKKLLIGWKDGLAYGADIIDPASGVYYKEGYLQTTLQDMGSVWHNDLITKVRADHLALQGNETVTVGAYLDRSSTIIDADSITDTSGRFTVMPLENGRVYEQMTQVTLGGDGTSSPTVLALQASQNKLDDESQF